KIADPDTVSLDQQDGDQQAKIPDEKWRQHRPRLRAQCSTVVEGRPAALKEQVAGDRAQAGNADPEKTVAEKDAQPVEQTMGPVERARRRIIGHMNEDDAGDQQYAHQIDAGGNVLIDCQTSHLYWAAPPLAAISTRADLSPHEKESGSLSGKMWRCSRKPQRQVLP